MKKGFILGIILVLSILICSFASADISVSKTTKNDVVAKELSQPATFALKINNGGDVDYAEFYTYVDAILAPRGAMKLEKGETKNVDLLVYPSAKLRDEKKGSYTFVYYVKGQQNTVEDRLVIRILPLKELLAISMPDTVTTDDSDIKITIENNESISFDKIDLELSSAFVKSSQSFGLGPYEKKEITLALDKAKVSSVLAGSYLVTLSLRVNDEATLKLEKSITIKEKGNIVTDEKSSGSLFYPIFTVIKTNTGNIVSDVEVVITKNAFANSFTSFKTPPDKAEKKGMAYTYTWYATLKPQESFEVEVKTNYLLPIGIIFAILIIAAIISIYLRTDLLVRKKAVRVKSKGGEFAMKVMIFLRARHNISNIAIRERLPHLAELYERFGAVKPDKIDKARGLLEWNILNMQAGEEAILSYIFYSKVSVVGRFELPRAFATFKDAKGKIKQLFSNAVYFFEERRV